MVWISNGILNPKAQLFKIQTNGCHYAKNHLKSGQKCLDFEWSGFQMVGTIAKAKAWLFKNRTIWNPTFKNPVFQMFPDFRSPTVLNFIIFFLTIRLIVQRQTWRGCSDCSVCLSAARSQSAGGPSPVSDSLMPASSFTRFVISEMSVSTWKLCKSFKQSI